MSRPATPEDIDEICRALPEVELGTSWGDLPTYKVPAGKKGRGFLPPTEIEKLQLVEDPDLPFFTVDHFCGFNAVLVQQSRLGEVSRDELAEIIEDAGLTVAPARLRKACLAERDAADHDG